MQQTANTVTSTEEKGGKERGISRAIYFTAAWLQGFPLCGSPCTANAQFTVREPKKSIKKRGKLETAALGVLMSESILLQLQNIPNLICIFTS